MSATIVGATPIGLEPNEHREHAALVALARRVTSRSRRDLELLLERSVELEADHVQLRNISDDYGRTEPWPTRVLAVRQTLAGALRGDLYWIAGEAAAANLLEVLGVAPQRPGPLTSLEREALTEIGMVVIGAVAETFSETLKSEVRTLGPSFSAGTPPEALHVLRRASDGCAGLRFWMEGSAGRQRIDQCVLLTLDPTSVPWFRRHVQASA